MNFIPLCVPNFEGNEKKYVDDAIEKVWVSTGGAYITKLEEEMAKYLRVENVAACQSGTSALHLPCGKRASCRAMLSWSRRSPLSPRSIR